MMVDTCVFWLSSQRGFNPTTHYHQMKYSQIINKTCVKVGLIGDKIRFNIGDSLLQTLSMADLISLAVRFLSEPDVTRLCPNGPHQTLLKGRRPHQPSPEDLAEIEKTGVPTLFFRGGEISFGEGKNKILIDYNTATEGMTFLNPENLDFRTFISFCGSLLRDLVTIKFDRRYFIPPAKPEVTSPAAGKPASDHGVLLGYLMATEALLMHPQQDAKNASSDILEILRSTVGIVIKRLSETTVPVEVRVTPSSIEEVPAEILEQIKSQVLRDSIEEIRLQGRNLLNEDVRKQRESLVTDRTSLDAMFEDVAKRDGEVTAQAQENANECLRLEVLKSSLEAREEGVTRAELLLEQQAFGQAQEAMEAARGRTATRKQLKELQHYRVCAGRVGRRDTDLPSQMTDLHRSKKAGQHGRRGKI